MEVSGMEARTTALSVQRELFDYGQLSGQHIKRCETAIDRIDKLQRRMASDVITIGNELRAVKELLGHGKFGPWLKHYFGWSRTTAFNMMSAAETFGKCSKFEHLTIDVSALYLLASDKCDDDTRAELLERAEHGERITHAAVKESLSIESDPPSFEDRIDKLIVRIRSLADCEQRCILIARLRNLCEELEDDE